MKPKENESQEQMEAKGICQKSIAGTLSANRKKGVSQKVTLGKGGGEAGRVSGKKS